MTGNGHPQPPTASRGQDWRLAPLALGSWAGAWLGTGQHAAWLWALSAVVLIGALVLRERWAIVGAAGLLLVGAGSLALAGQRDGSTLARLGAQEAIVHLEVRIDTEPRPSPPRPPMPPSASARVQVWWVEGRGVRTVQSLPALLTASGEMQRAVLELRAGQRVQLEARLAAPRPDDDAAATVRVRRIVEVVAEPDVLQRLAHGMREGLRKAVAHSPEDQRALVPSLVVGDTSRISTAMDEDFRTTGLTHLMAVSGSNLALMLGVLLGLLRGFGVRGWGVRIASVGGVLMFVLVCGPEPSVLRAAAMGIVALAAVGAGQGRRSVRGLLVAVTALMVADPWLARAPGFWLSCAATLGIVLLAPWCIAMLTAWAPRWLAEALAIPLSAQVFTQPIVTGLSGEVSMVGLIANVVAGPFVGPTTMLGFAAACSAWLPPLSVLLGWLAGWTSQPIVWVATLGAGLPGATLEWLPGALGVLTMILASAALVACLGPVLARAWASATVLAVVAVGTFVTPTPPGWPGQWQVAFCDVGQGDATLVRAEERSAILIDTGPDARAVLRCLDELGIDEVPVVVLTHFHADHIGGFEAVVDAHAPRLVLTSALGEPRAAVAAVRASAGGAEVRPAVPGETITVGAATWTTVSAWSPTGVAAESGTGESSAENDASVVGVAQAGELRVLLAGDAEPDGQAAALRGAAERGLDLRAQVLKLPHHGSSRQHRGFFAASGARVAVASAGEGNAYGHPSPRTVRLAEELGMTVARTDVDGTVTVAVDGDLRLRRRDG